MTAVAVVVPDGAQDVGRLRLPSRISGSRVWWVRARAASTLATGLALVALLAGCGADVEKRQAAAAADAFSAAVVSDPPDACRMLASRTVESLESQGSGECAKDLAEAGIPPAGEQRSVSVAGHTAQVRYRGEAVFLSLFDTGWKVAAVGCTRLSADPSVPYDCLLEGSRWCASCSWPTQCSSRSAWSSVW